MKTSSQFLPAQVKTALDSLQKLSSKTIREQMGSRYGIHAKKAFGVKVSDIQKVAKRLGKSHELAEALWQTGWYEARLLASWVDEPERVTPAQMDRWCRDFDNWGICDTVCFVLFDRTPHAFDKVKKWSKSREEFIKRAAFALLASLSGHDKKSGDEPFLRCLPLIEKAASDDRNFVKKGVSWALRGVGRRSPTLNKPAVALAQRLAESSVPSERWIGKDALRDFAKVAARKRA